MAQRRMLSKAVVETEDFYTLSPQAQALYLHFVVNADDDGFIGSPAMYMRLLGVDRGTLSELVNADLIITFTRRAVVTDWLRQNKMSNLKKTPTEYQDEWVQIEVDDLKRYRLKLTAPALSDEAERMPEKSQKATGTSLEKSQQTSGEIPHSVVKGSLGQDRLGQDSGSDSEASSEETTTTAPADPLKPVQLFWESNGFGSMTQYLWEDFEKWRTDFEELGATPGDAVALIIKALQACVEAGPDKRNQRYMRSILNRYAQSRYTSVADVEAAEKARKAAQQPTSKRSGNTARHDVYHDHRLDDAFQEAIDRMAANGNGPAPAPEDDPLPF